MSIKLYYQDGTVEDSILRDSELRCIEFFRETNQLRFLAKMTQLYKIEFSKKNVYLFIDYGNGYLE